MSKERIDQIKETLKQAQRAQSSNWGHLYYKDVGWLVSLVENYVWLSEADMRAFLEALDNPPEPNERLRKLFEK